VRHLILATVRTGSLLECFKRQKKALISHNTQLIIIALRRTILLFYSRSSLFFCCCCCCCCCCAIVAKTFIASRIFELQYKVCVGARHTACFSVSLSLSLYLSAVSLPSIIREKCSSSKLLVIIYTRYISSQ
jgi:hypothetical protein